MKKFTIYGSCVTRDIFNFLDNEIYKPEVTIECNPVTTLFGNALDIDRNDINVDTEFINRMIYYCFAKHAMNVVQNADSEYFVFDMACERFPIQTWKYKEAFTSIPVTWNTYQLGNMLRATDKYKDIEISNWHMPDADSKWLEYIEEFCGEILKKYEQHKIILIRLEQVDKVLGKENIYAKSFTANRNEFTAGIDKKELREKQNRLIQQAEEYVLKLIPNCYVIKMPRGVMANTLHHFSEHPLHFVYPYYEYAAEAIKLIAKDREDENESRKVVQKELDFLWKRYNEKFIRINQVINKSEKTKVQFFGSSDLFSALNDKQTIYYENPICDVNVEALLSEPFPMTRKECQNHMSEEEMVRFLNDTNKVNKLQLQCSDAQWLVLDLRSECNNMIVLGAKSDKIIMNSYGHIVKYLFKKHTHIRGGGDWTIQMNGMPGKRSLLASVN